ncbi:DUF1440 domain-containing protein [Bordetella trematum]|uniref:DUF1440 domain-containing protein n=1 Tax=Bordetella trematum TaxID=123899 RepID=UPI00155842F3|nr:DUF1440 domain-containing protein [Bordetella trematum]
MKMHQAGHDVSGGRLVWVGIVAGFFSALVKSGIETLLVPRPPSAVPPPIRLLELMGADANNMVYTFNLTAVNWGGNGVHILFSIVMAIVYCFLVRACSKVATWWGIPFAWVTATIGAHCIVLPLIGAGPVPWEIGTDGFISEIIGTAIWIWTIECVRRVMVARTPA